MDDEKEFAQLNIIPLVDVMLVLLTIVLTTSTFVAKGLLPVELPRAAHGRSEAQKSAVIALDKSGALSMDGLPLSMPTLAQRLASLQTTTPVVIQSDRGLRLQTFIDLLDLLKGLGFTKVSVQTEAAPHAS